MPPKIIRKLAFFLVFIFLVVLFSDGMESSQAAPPRVEGYRYFDYSRSDWGANPLFDSRVELFAPAYNGSYKAEAVDLDSGRVYSPVINPGKLISLPDRNQVPVGIVVHDTATPNPSSCSFENSAATLRTIQTYHALNGFYHVGFGPGNPDPRQEVDNRGLVEGTSGDIGYHFLIDCAGRIFEGRAGGIGKVGRHVHRHNQGEIGISLIGTFNQRPPSLLQRAALVRLITRLSLDLGINPLEPFKQVLLNGTIETLSRNGKPVLSLAGHVEFPDNDHGDPEGINMDHLRKETSEKLANPEGGNFSETGQTLVEPFKSFWSQNGGLPIFGFPISPLLSETNPEDGKTYRVQYFERARFELHPELVGTSYYVSLGLLGLLRAARSRNLHQEPFTSLPPPTSFIQDFYFRESGHYLKSYFQDYFFNHGGLAIFGLPLSEEFQEETGGGQTFRVQYFERARFEYHPEAPAQYRVLLGRLGADLYYSHS